MGLESLLKPVKWIDEQILREYTKITKKWEDKERNKYILAGALSVAGYISILVIPSDPDVLKDISITDYLIGGTVAFSYVGLWAHDVIHSFNNIISKKSEETSGEIVEDKFNHITKKIQRFARLPMFGLGMLAFYEFSNLFIESGLSEITLDYAFVMGLGFTSLASSMYIKDSDPKLLNKQPFWKSGYEWLLTKADNYLPQPVPKLVPIQSLH